MSIGKAICKARHHHAKIRSAGYAWGLLPHPGSPDARLGTADNDGGRCSACFLATTSHRAPDAMTNGGVGVSLFSPFDTTRYFLPSRPIKTSLIVVGQFFNGRGAAVKLSEIIYAWSKQPEKAMDYLRQIMAIETEPENKAHCVLAMGQTVERLRDYESATRYYKEALAMEPAVTRTWYLIHNNLGYRFNTLGRFAEGQVFCLKAIEIDDERHNAHKNLGITLENQGMFAEAARCYVTATRLNASDRRAYDLLEKLLDAHPELSIESGADTECCRKAVEFANNERLRAAPVLHRGLRRQLILLRLKVKGFFGKFRR